MTDSGATADTGVARDGGAAADAGSPMDGSASSDAAMSTDASSPGDAVVPCVEVPETGSISVTGELTTSSPRWHRPISDDCPAELAELDVDEDYYVETTVFCNHGTTANFIIRQMRSDSGPGLPIEDPFLTIYDGVGIPADATMCIGANDDDPDSISLDSKVEVTIRAGQYATAAASSVDPIGWGGETGTYRLRINRY